jgi:hypothetical protein
MGVRPSVSAARVFLRYRAVGLSKVLPPLGVPDDDVAASGLGQHPCGDFAGERAFFVPIEILPADRYFAALGGVHRSGDRRKWRRNHHVAMRRFRHQW